MFYKVFITTIIGLFFVYPIIEVFTAGMPFSKVLTGCMLLAVCFNLITNVLREES